MYCDIQSRTPGCTISCARLMLRSALTGKWPPVSAHDYVIPGILNRTDDMAAEPSPSKAAVGERASSLKVNETGLSDHLHCVDSCFVQSN